MPKERPAGPEKEPSVVGCCAGVANCLENHLTKKNDQMLRN